MGSEFCSGGFYYSGGGITLLIRWDLVCHKFIISAIENTLKDFSNKTTFSDINFHLKLQNMFIFWDFGVRGLLATCLNQNT